MNLYSAHRQWSERPADERFWSLKDLRETLQTEQNHNAEKLVPLATLRAAPHDGDMCLVGQQNNPANLTHWSFQQLSSWCGIRGLIFVLSPPSLLLTASIMVCSN